MIAALSGVTAAVSSAIAASTPATPVNNDVNSESAKSGPIGLVVIIVLCVVCYFLFKSLSKHLRRIRDGALPVTPEPVARPRPAVDIAVPRDTRVRDEPAPGSASPPPS